MPELNQSFKGISNLADIVQELSLARDIETIMGIVRKAARTFTGADGATFILREGDKCHYADEDAITPLWKGGRFPMSACISGWVMLNRKEAVIEDIYSDDRIPVDAYRPTFVKSLLMVPIRKNDPIGAIGNYWATPHLSTSEEVAILQALADTTAVAMENIQVYSQLELRLKELNISNDQLQIELRERKQTEDALRESEGRYRTLADSGQALIWTAGLDKKCDYFNIPWLAFTGKRIEDELGDGWVKGVHPDDLQRCIDIYVTAFDLREKFSMNYRIRHNSDEYRWIQDDGTPRYNSKGEFIGYIGHCLDITDRIRAEEILRTAQKLESLGLLAGGIAHDFNNLMGGIFGYIDMASEATKEAKVTSYLSKAMNTIERARALTGQLLTFAKGGAPIQKIDNLFPFVEETAKFALSGANVSCQFDVQDDLWACNFDKNQFGQVIDNLIINAQQAMPVGGTIELTARNIALAEKEHPLLLNGNYVKICVKDTGVGIPKEHISKIFDPFFTTKAKGHGLGLATCYSIINRHGGCIDVESDPGKGSTFKVYLPASTESATSVNENAAKMHRGNGTFLIMDDEEVMRDTIKDMLESLGYSVVSKENGKDAIDFFASEIKANRKITAMIFDLTVPGGMGGKAAIEEIRKTNTDIPGFVASGYADDPVMKNPTEYGFMASICKPFRKSELSEMLNKYMQTKK